MNKAQKVIDIAFAEVGVQESPANSNETKYGKWFGLNGVAWCGIFASWAYSKAGVPLEKIGYSKGFAGTQTALKHFQETGQMTTNPAPADLVFYDWDANGQPNHVGIFNGWVKGKRGVEFYAIEGNTSLKDQSNGGEVMSRQRVNKNVKFVHPKVLD